MDGGILGYEYEIAPVRVLPVEIKTVIRAFTASRSRLAGGVAVFDKLIVGKDSDRL